MISPLLKATPRPVEGEAASVIAPNAAHDDLKMSRLVSGSKLIPR